MSGDVQIEIDPRAFARETEPNVIRIGPACDRFVPGATLRNPARVDRALWELARKNPVVEAMLESHISHDGQFVGAALIVSTKGSEVEIENRTDAPVQIRVATPRATDTAAA